VQPLAWDTPLPTGPRRILVAGTSGAGKTTLAVRLGLPHIDIDGLFHGPDWTPRLEFVADVAAFVAGDEWVTEWQYSAVRHLVLARVDLLVGLDLSRLRVMSQIVPRTVRRRLCRVELWNGNLEPPLWTIFTDRDHIVRWAWRTHPKTAARMRAVLASHDGPPGGSAATRREVAGWLGPVTARATAR
jgi:adenylate kinase family enzyme